MPVKGEGRAKARRNPPQWKATSTDKGRGSAEEVFTTVEQPKLVEALRTKREDAEAVDRRLEEAMRGKAEASQTVSTQELRPRGRSEQLQQWRQWAEKQQANGDTGVQEEAAASAAAVEHGLEQGKARELRAEQSATQGDAGVRTATTTAGRQRMMQKHARDLNAEQSATTAEVGLKRTAAADERGSGGDTGDPRIQGEVVEFGSEGEFIRSADCDRQDVSMERAISRAIAEAEQEGPDQGGLVGKWSGEFPEPPNDVSVCVHSSQ